MARVNYNKRTYRKRKSTSSLEQFAYKMALVQQGLKKDTRVKDAYDAGMNRTPRDKSKPLY